MKFPTPTIGNRLRGSRMSAGMTQQEMAEVIGRRRGMISGYENDHNEIPLSVAAQWAEITDVSLDWLALRDRKESAA